MPESSGIEKRLEELVKLGLVIKHGDSYLLSDKSIKEICAFAYHIAEDPEIQTPDQAFEAGCIYAYVKTKGKANYEEIEQATRILMTLLEIELDHISYKNAS